MTPRKLATVSDPTDTAALALEHPAEPVEPPTPATTASDAAAVLAKRKAEVVAADKAAVTMADLDAVERGLREDFILTRPVSAQPLTAARKPEAAPALGVGALVGIGLTLFLFWWLSRKRKA